MSDGNDDPKDLILFVEPACRHKVVPKKDVAYSLFYLCEHEDTKDKYFKILWWDIFNETQKELWGRGCKLQAIQEAITDVVILCCNLCRKAHEVFPKGDGFYYKLRCSNRNNPGKVVEFFHGVLNPDTPLPPKKKPNWITDCVSEVFGEDFEIDPEDWKF